MSRRYCSKIRPAHHPASRITVRTQYHHARSRIAVVALLLIVECKIRCGGHTPASIQQDELAEDYKNSATRNQPKQFCMSLVESHIPSLKPELLLLARLA